MNTKIIISFFIFLLLSGNCNALAITPINEEDKNAFQLTLDFVKANPEYNMVIVSDNHLFKGLDNNRIFACKYYPDGHTELYDVYYGYCFYPNEKYTYFYHIFEHGCEKQTWRYLTDNVFWINC